MVVKEDGTKWACTSCLKGHRVSGCNHTDRELHLVPKKGRPVTQCQHCRQERKKRSAHVSCDCAATDKPHHSKEKCIHLRAAEERAKTAGFFDEKDHAHLATVAEEQGCCCHHGGKCTCALNRKDSSDEGPLHCKPAVNKPRLESTKSEGSLTVFTNGHHKPVHRKNHAAHECGMPYKMPMPRARTEHDVNYAARRSVDSLAQGERQVDFSQFKAPVRPLEMQADLFASASGLTSDKFNMIDFSDLQQTRTNESIQSEAFPFDQMISSSQMISPFEEWPAQPIDVNNPLTWTTTDACMVQPALTVASSGTQSEIDEIPCMDDVYTHGMPSIEETNFDSADPVLGNSPQTNRRSLPPGFFGNIDFTEQDWQRQVTEDKPDFPAFGFTDPWQQRAPASYASPGRPTARSVGPSSAPGADIMKQLFPDMDIEGGYRKDEDDTFVTQAWADGSMSVPTDPFGTPLGMDGFNVDYNARQWPQ